MVRFWKTMDYGCGSCGTIWTFYLESGLEGPRHHKRPPPGEGRPWGTPVEEAGEDWIWFTVSGRVILPVPYVAMGCPECQGPPPWSPMDPVLAHINWDEDQVLGPDMNPPEGEFPHFRYPANWTQNKACGIPVFPGVLEAPEGSVA